MNEMQLSETAENSLNCGLLCRLHLKNTHKGEQGHRFGTPTMAENTAIYREYNNINLNQNNFFLCVFAAAVAL